MGGNGSSDPSGRDRDLRQVFEWPSLATGPFQHDDSWQDRSGATSSPGLQSGSGILAQVSSAHVRVAGP